MVVVFVSKYKQTFFSGNFDDKENLVLCLFVQVLKGSFGHCLTASTAYTTSDLKSDGRISDIHHSANAVILSRTDNQGFCTLIFLAYFVVAMVHHLSFICCPLQ